MELIRQWDVDGIDMRIGKQLLIPSIGSRRAELARDSTSLALVARRQRSKGGTRCLAHCRDDALNCNRRGAEDAPIDLLRHGRGRSGCCCRELRVKAALHARDVRAHAEEQFERHRSLKHCHSVAVESSTAVLASRTEQLGEQRHVDDFGDPQRWSQRFGRYWY